jgi:hypothetical protein
VSTTIHGHGFAIPVGETREVPDNLELARRAAKREAEARQARRDQWARTKEAERIGTAISRAEGEAVRSYYADGGRAKYRWVVTAVPIEDEPDPFGDLS